MTDYNKLVDNIKKVLGEDHIANWRITIESYNDFEVKVDVKSLSADAIRKIEKENNLRFDSIEYSYAPSSNFVLRVVFRK